MDNQLTLKVKEYAYQLGADLVGISNIQRHHGAPLRMSPQGLLPTAKSVIVCAIHHPDAVMELDGEVHPQIMGPYGVQITMNTKLDLISFRIGRMLDDLGYQTIPIASSNIWRDRGYKDMDTIFAPDISHIYGAVCAGLGEMGWNGLCITPEYGPRVRFVSIITEAELTPSPLYQGPKLCDMCGECIRNCPTDAYRKEVNGVKKLEIEGKTHVFCNKNLWRCSWAEAWCLDLDKPIPDVINEKVVLEHVHKDGIRDGEMGVCQKVCLPKHLRVRDEDYCKIAPRRKRHVTPSDLPVNRQVYDILMGHARKWAMDSVHFISQQSLAEADIDIRKQLPDGVSAILLTARYQLPAGAIIDRNHYQKTARFAIEFVELDMCRELEKLGYSALPQASISHEHLRKLCGVAATEDTEILTGLVLCSAPLADRAETHISATNPAKDLKQQLKAIAKEQGADLFGVASAKTIDELADQIRVIRKDETIFSAVDKNHLLKAYDPEVTQHKRPIHGATEVLPGAKSVIVLGMHYPETPAVRMGQPPAEAVAPYVFTQFETNRLSALMAYSVCQTLNGMGYEAIFTHNLTGAGSWVGSPKGLHHDATCNALEAVAAGIGQMALNGTAVTEEYGIHQRFVAIVTNADLEADAVKGGLAAACAGCEKCLNACPTCALRKEALTELTVAGQKVTYLPVNANRCDWATKFALVAEEGNMYTGNDTNVPCPDEITAEVLADALRQHDPLFKNRPVIGQRCVISCPLR